MKTFVDESYWTKIALEPEVKKLYPDPNFAAIIEDDNAGPHRTTKTLLAMDEMFSR